MRYALGLLWLLLSVSLWGQSTPLQRQWLVQLAPQQSPTVLADALKAAGIQQRLEATLAPEWGLYLWSSAQPERFVSALAQRTEVRAWQPNAAIAWRNRPNDALYDRQWGLQRIGAPEAWDYSTGGTTALGDVLVAAIIDGSFDVTHQDLAPNLWHNRAEIPNNGLDDDRNGFVDDYLGWQVVFDTDRHDYGPITNHGTSVAGIIGARGGNGVGIAGINWQAQLMLVSAHTSQAITTLANIVKAYHYIWKHRRLYNATQGQEGAYVVAINASWGVDFAQAADHPIWCALYDTLGQAGILSVAATTNNDEDIDQVGDMPCTCPSEYLIAVGESTEQESLAGGFGAQHVDLFAPSATRTTRWGDLYGDFGGTSGAAPHVTGAVVLLYSYDQMDWAHFQLDQPAQAALLVKDLLLRTVEQSGDFEASVSGGRLDLGQAMRELDAYWMPATANDWIGLYPVPAGEQLTLITATQTAGQHQIHLYNSAGQWVNTYRYEQEAPGRRHWPIDLGDLPMGVYHLRWVWGQEAVTRSFIKGN